MKKILCLLIALLMITGCSSSKSNNETNTQVEKTEMFTDSDYETDYRESESTVIDLNNNSASCDDSNVNIDGSTVTITNEGTYVIKGTLDDGMIIVDSDKNTKMHIVLDGVSITSSTSASIYVKQADKVFFTLVNDNTLSNGGSFVNIDENNIDSVIFSKDDITFNGNGTLTINSPVGHGIVSKDDMVFTGGHYTINSSSHGITANNSVRVINTTFSISSGKDGMQSENNEDESLGFVYIEKGSFDIVSEGDGISASSYMQIQDGTFDIVSGGGYVNGESSTSNNWGGFMGGRGPSGNRENMHESSTSDEDSESIKGLKVGTDLTINGGTFTIDSADDTVHSNGNVVINNGTLTLSTGDDGIHADNSLKINDGIIKILESYEGLEGLTIDIYGGDIELKSNDDGLNSNGGSDMGGMGGPRGEDQFASNEDEDSYINIEGGHLYVNASGDGMDANGYITISDGYIVVIGPTSGDTATLDYDTTANISGGTFIGTGAMGMAQIFSDSSTQGVFAVTANASANTEIVLKDSSNKEIIRFSPELAYNVVILSSPNIKKGDSYTVYIGEASGTFEAY